MLIDSHCHLVKEYYDNIDEIIARAKECNVTTFFNIGTNTKENKEILSLIDKYPKMYGAIGIHPSQTSKATEEDLKFIEDNLKNKKIIAIGEIGLDYHYPNTDKESQITWFKHQLKIAENHQIPVIIHSRDAVEDTINILKDYKVKGIIHSFAENLEIANKYIDLGFLLGINGVLTFKNSKLAEVIKQVPLEYIVLETDCPYLTPDPFRGKKNEPKYIAEITTFLSKIKKADINEIASITSKNLADFFDI